MHLFPAEGKGDGVFLVRDSNTSPGDYVLSVLHNVSENLLCYQKWNKIKCKGVVLFSMSHKLFPNISNAGRGRSLSNTAAW